MGCSDSGPWPRLDKPGEYHVDSMSASCEADFTKLNESSSRRSHGLAAGVAAAALGVRMLLLDA